MNQTCQVMEPVLTYQSTEEEKLRATREQEHSAPGAQSEVNTFIQSVLNNDRILDNEMNPQLQKLIASGGHYLVKRKLELIDEINKLETLKIKRSNQRLEIEIDNLEKKLKNLKEEMEITDPVAV